MVRGRHFHLVSEGVEHLDQFKACAIKLRGLPRFVDVVGDERPPVRTVIDHGKFLTAAFAIRIPEVIAPGQHISSECSGLTIRVEGELQSWRSQRVVVLPVVR